MCTSYYIENSKELTGITRAAVAHRNKHRMVEKLARPILTQGTVRPNDIAPVIAPDRKGEAKTFPMVWGFTGKISLIASGKVETADKSSVFRKAYERHRCIIPASWYYEHKHIPSTTLCSNVGERRKESMYGSRPERSLPDVGICPDERYMVQTRGSSVTFIAGLYRIEDIDGIKIPHFVLLTREASEDLRFLHSRMPLILDANDSNMINGWIDPSSGPWVLERIIRNSVTEMIFEKSQ